ncbi:MAG: hypothetical protein V4528_14435 [Pseudomonadota bacterium]
MSETFALFRLPWIKLASIFIMKAALIYLLLPLLWVDITLFGIGIPRYIFEKDPFLMAVVFVAAIGTTISVVLKSKVPVMWAIFITAYSVIFFISIFTSLAFIAICMGIGAVSFLYRSRFTEPFLVLLPIVVGSWLFLQFVYGFSLVAWVNYSVGHGNLSESLLQGALALKGQAIQIVVITPLLMMYFLGKHGYVRLYSFFGFHRKRNLT